MHPRKVSRMVGWRRSRVQYPAFGDQPTRGRQHSIADAQSMQRRHKELTHSGSRPPPLTRSPPVACGPLSLIADGEGEGRHRRLSSASLARFIGPRPTEGHPVARARCEIFAYRLRPNRRQRGPPYGSGVTKRNCPSTAIDQMVTTRGFYLQEDDSSRRERVVSVARHSRVC
jgi:hypothetical protein